MSTTQISSQATKSLRFRLTERLLADGLIVVVLIAWALLAQGLPDFVLPGPEQVAIKLWQLFTEPQLLQHTLLSALRVLASVLIAVLIGTTLALVAFYLPIFAHVIERRIQPFLNSFPSVGWAILAVIWFEISTASVLFVQIMILIPFCLINVAQGLRELDQELLEMGRSFSRSRWRQLRLLILPLLLPYIVAAMRIAYGVAWKIALVAELFGADSGLGYLMLQGQTMADAALVFAACLAIVVLFFIGEN